MAADGHMVSLFLHVGLIEAATKVSKFQAWYGLSLSATGLVMTINVFVGHCLKFNSKIGGKKWVWRWEPEAKTGS